MERKYYIIAIGILLGSVIVLWYQLHITSATYTILLPEKDDTPVTLTYGEQTAFADENFFRQVEQKFIEEKTDFISADLTNQRLKLYKKGKVVEDVPILSKGLEGSWWETPSGLFAIHTQKENHFSTFGSVHMPYAMQFQGNFFIHGWPYYPDGTPVKQSFSGGCIRLNTEDAKKIYTQTHVGIPVLVHEAKQKETVFTYPSLKPNISASSFLVADVNNNVVLVDHNPDAILPIASITKLMTALIAIEYVNIEKLLRVSPEALVPTSKPRLQAGSYNSIYHLLYPLLRESSNEAAIVIGNSVNPDRFITFMNQKAKSVGMEHTAFTNTSGSDSGNVSTARDLFRFAKYLHTNRNFVLNITKGDLELEKTYGKLPYEDLGNYNIYSDTETFLGGKIGKTQAAGETMVALFNVPIGNTQRAVVVIALGSSDVEKDINTLLEYVVNKYAVPKRSTRFPL